MNNTSWRHHYLPVFYLKGFCKESGKIKIYDVEQKRFIKNGKEFSPESYFFEKNGNTLFFEDKKADFLETDHYSHFDNNISKLIDKINSSDHTTRYNVTEDDMPVLNHFVSLMYWRLPNREEELKHIISQNELNDLGVKLSNESGKTDKELEEKFKNSPQFFTTYKYYNSLMDSIRGINCRTPFSIIETYENFPCLCSDNPVIFEKDFCPKVYEDDYLFPLSGKRLFLKGHKRGNFEPFLRMLVDIVVYKQAVKYVACTDEKYIEMLDNNFEKYNITIEELKADIFRRIK